MVEKIMKLFVISEEGIGSSTGLSRDVVSSLRGRVVILDPERSEVAKNLKIDEKGVFGVRFR